MSQFTALALSLYSRVGERKYVNNAERRRVLQSIETLPRDRALFTLVLLWTGGRISEVLALTARSSCGRLIGISRSGKFSETRKRATDAYGPGQGSPLGASSKR
jgi:hypothetical protein